MNAILNIHNDDGKTIEEKKLSVWLADKEKPKVICVSLGDRKKGEHMQLTIKVSDILEMIGIA